MYEDNDGYMKISLYDDDKIIHISEHRLNALINYSLKDVLNNNIHHKNYCRLDNRLENLEMINKSEHISLHKYGNKYSFNPCLKIRKKKHKSCKQGFYWRVRPITKDGKQKTLQSVNLNKCIEKVIKFIQSEENTKGYISYQVIGGGEN